MNLKKQVQFATLLALSQNDQFIKQSQQTQITQRDINLSGIFSKISNLQLVAFDKREEDGELSKQPENMEMLQLGRADSVRNFALNGDDMNELMIDSFKPKHEK